MMPKSKALVAFKRFSNQTLFGTLAVVAALGLTSCSKTPGNTGGGSVPEMIKPAAPAGFMSAGDSDPELIAVKEKAQSKLTDFTAAFAKRTAGQQFLVKAPFKEGAYEEHKWVIVDQVKKDEMDGHIERPSQTIKHLKVGQIITVNDYNIEDWAYIDKAGQQQGGWSVAVLRKREAAPAH
jgi:uncharacterized protein YegJ (DUF2314 family)